MIQLQPPPGQQELSQVRGVPTKNAICDRLKESQTASIYPIDRGSGTCGVTITSINGVSQTPPQVTFTATPTILWPPNNQSVAVAMSGTVMPGTQAIPFGGITGVVNDEYDQVRLVRRLA